MKNTRDRTYVVIVYMPVKRFPFANVDLLPIENDIEKKKRKNGRLIQISGSLILS